MGEAKIIHKSLPGKKYTLCGLDKNRVKHSIFVHRVTCKSCKKKLRG